MKPDFNETENDGFASPEITIKDGIPREGWYTSTAVSYVVSAVKTVSIEHKDSPALAAISKILWMFLHREIREKGGAYGGYAIYNPEDGIFYFASNQDPHIISTLKAYEKAISFIKSGKYNDEDIKEAILMVCSKVDINDPPSKAATKTFYRKINFLSDGTRIIFKKRLLALTKNKVKNAANKYFNSTAQKQAVVVISNKNRLKKVNIKSKHNPFKLIKI